MVEFGIEEVCIVNFEFFDKRVVGDYFCCE